MFHLLHAGGLWRPTGQHHAHALIPLLRLVCPAALIPLPCPALVVQTYGPRFNVLLSSYETVLKDKTELKKLQFEVKRNAWVAGLKLHLSMLAFADGPGSSRPSACHGAVGDCHCGSSGLWRVQVCSAVQHSVQHY